MESNLFKSFRTLSMWGIFFMLFTFGLFLGDLLSFKEMITMEVCIFMVYVILNLVNFINDLNKENKLLKTEKEMFSKALIESTKVNDFLIQMCEIADKHIDHPSWKEEWNKFIKNVKMKEDVARKLFNELNNMFSGDLNPKEQKQKLDDIMNKSKDLNSFGFSEKEVKEENKDIKDFTLEELKLQLNRYIEEEKYEECTVIRELIELRESESDEL
ncbi:hypothetical protein COB55_03670 [Candidatus Wolfebacteria bacterium]|nr:MAG: hypothetical protein COB55_03670 [Candidatus Wolfebacteria bacterium]